MQNKTQTTLDAADFARLSAGTRLRQSPDGEVWRTGSVRSGDYDTDGRTVVWDDGGMSHIRFSEVAGWQLRLA